MKQRTTPVVRSVAWVQFESDTIREKVVDQGETIFRGRHFNARALSAGDKL
jgi:hypothetical protein